MPTTPVSRDRLKMLIDAANPSLNGIDFVEIASADQSTLPRPFSKRFAVGRPGDRGDDHRG